MMKEYMKEKAFCYLKELCMDIPERPVGSRGNRAAVELIETYLRSFNFETSMPVFDCMNWQGEWAILRVEGETFPVLISPYCPGGRVRAPLCTASTVDELKQIDGEGKVVLLKGEIAQEQLLPKNFPFLDLPEHRQILDLLGNKGFRAVISATSYNPEMAGGVYPFPLIEDGDFHLPSVYLTDQEGERLAGSEGKVVSLEVKATRELSKGHNVVARKGASAIPRVVFCAHLDSKQGTPGAIDNATGITVLLLLAEILKKYQGRRPLEIVALNGEDYYSNPGEVLYMEEIQNHPENIFLGINIDGVGYNKGNTAISTYGCSAVVEEIVLRLIYSYPGIVRGDPWYQGDHALFLQNKRPALGVTSELMKDILAVAHTPQDKLNLVDVAKLADITDFLRVLMHELEGIELK